MTWEALDLALALHAAPARAVELRARPLPGGMRNLLRVALGREDDIAAASAATGQPGSLLVEAARFFVEQLLLARECEADPWRVLGVAPGAGEAELRANHHLLVRLVHPDRSDDWPSAYADRVNRAWRELRVNAGRALAVAASAHARPPPGAAGESWVERKARPVADSAVPAQVWARRHSGQRPRVALGLLVAGVLGLAWWNWPAPQRDAPPPARPAALPAMAPATAPAAIPVQPAASAPLVAIDNLLPDPPPARPAPATPVPVAVPHPTGTAATAAPGRGRRAAATASRTEPGAGAAPGVDPAQPDVVQPSAVESLAATATEADAPKPQVVIHAPSDSETLALLDRYAALYAQGDLAGILGLYARRVHEDYRQLAPIAAGYARVFDDTTRRSIELEALHWQRHEDRITGQARYKLSQVPRNGLWRRAERGRVDFELVRDGGTSRFLRFTSIADRGS